jgi:Domain of unknown function (DUF6916)
MLDTLTSADFSTHLEESFTLTLADGSQHAMTLVKITELGERQEETGGRRPFSLIFRGPLELRLPQQIYSLTHPGVGSLQIFIVPVGPDQTGQCYEAIFN